jgi:rhomboid protease GluP
LRALINLRESALVTRPGLYTILIITLNIFLFMLMVLEGERVTGTFSNILGPYVSIESCVSFGCLDRTLYENGHWFRLITYSFVHQNILHLVFNLYGIWMLGLFIEKELGSARFITLWLFTSMAGAIASSINDPSTAICGSQVPLCGLSGAILFLNPRGEQFKGVLFAAILPVVLVYSLLAFDWGTFTNSSHLAAFIAGVLLISLVRYLSKGNSGHWFWKVLHFASLVLLFASFTALLLT